jgi:hypothetical protein
MSPVSRRGATEELDSLNRHRKSLSGILDVMCIGSRPSRCLLLSMRMVGKGRLKLPLRSQQLCIYDPSVVAQGLPTFVTAGALGILANAALGK